MYLHKYRDVRLIYRLERTVKDVYACLELGKRQQSYIKSSNLVRRIRKYKKF